MIEYHNSFNLLKSCIKMQSKCTPSYSIKIRRRFTRFSDMKCFRLTPAILGIGIVLIVITLIICINYGGQQQYENVINGNRRNKVLKYSLELDFDEVLSGEMIVRVEQSNPSLIEYVRKAGYIKSPSAEPYNLKEPNVDPSIGQSKVVLKILKNMPNGFFVECGALDGETRSNTLYMEKEFGWTGLLVEADPSNFQLLMKKHRKAWATNVCLAVHEYPHKVMFHQNFNIGKIIAEPGSSRDSKIGDKLVSIQCLPFFTLMTAIKVTTIDYFSLDVEGSEIAILKTIPFHQILIRVLSIEYIYKNVDASRAIESFMKDKGYRVETKVNDANHLAHDLIFVHESIK